ncbi:MAG: aspartyl protease family protein [Flavisolibacter sp.]
MPDSFFKYFILFTILFQVEMDASARLMVGDSNLYSHPLHINIAAVAEDSMSCVIPFSRAGNLIVVQAKADSIDGNFILDTGAPHLILNMTYFRNYPATSQPDAEQNSVTGAGPAVVKTSVDRFSIGSMEYSKVEADMVNLGHIENSKGIKILGLLGMEFFKQCEMIIDYDKGLIYLHRIGRKEASKYKSEQLNDASSFTEVPIEIMDNKIVVRTEMAGKKLRFIIDSGAESNLLDSRLPNKIFENVVVTGRVLLSGTGSKKLEALSGDLKHLKIGKEEIGTLPIVITNLEKTCVSYNGCMDGMLGFDFLSLHKLGFNFVNHKMYLWK